MRRWTSTEAGLAFDVGLIVAALGGEKPREPGLQVRRPDDLLVLELRLRNLELDTGGGGPRLIRSRDDEASILLVDVPPQSFGEEAFYIVSEADKDPVPGLASARVRMSGPSRLAFVMPDAQSELPYTLAGVLAAMRTWPQSLDGSALPDPGPEGSGRVLGRGQLYGLLQSEAVQVAIARLTDALQATGADGVGQAVVDAGARVADQAAGALTGSAGALLGRVTLRAMQSELDGLHERFESLRSGPAHQAAVAALSLTTAASLAPAARRARAGIDLIGEIPYLPLVLAPHAPGDTSTALEIPYRLLLSPIEDARWQHRDDPADHGGRTELWHTRLRTAAGDQGPDGVSKVRAIWSPDYPIDDFSTIDDPNDPRPFRMSLTAGQRQALVKLMAGYNEWQGRTRFTPRASRARRLHLSSLGALTDLEGAWDQLPDDVDLEQWRHLASLGRDGYVRVVERGYLLPFGHNAAKVTVTERRFESLDDDRATRIAVLRQRTFIIVRRRVMEYAGERHVHGGRGFPFTRVEILTRVTPNLAKPGVGASQLVPADGDPTFDGQKAFWPMLSDTEDVRFELVATDLAGTRVAFAMPMLFISKEVNRVKAPEARRAYNRSEIAQRRTAPLSGATVCFAPFDPGDPGDPRLPTQSMTFAAGELTQLLETQANFYPETDLARVGIKPVQKLLGRPDAIADAAYPAVFKDHGYDPAANAGGLFLQVVNQEQPLAFGGAGAKTDAIGGLAAPGMSILGLSRVMGPVSGQPPADMTDRTQVEQALGNVVGGTFNPADFFKNATILGGVALGDLLETVFDLTGASVPKLLSRELTGPDRVESTFDWQTEVTKSDPLKLMIPRADPGKATELSMHGQTTAPLNAPGGATSSATARLTNFKVNLFGFIVVWFDDLQFVANNGKKPDVIVAIHPGDDGIAFGGPLEFVNELRKVIPADGFSDPPSLSVTPSGIAASFSLNLPALEVGVFALKNASLGAGFNLPFDATPASVRFNFSERQHPFSLTVSMLGGGGFFAIGVSARGVQEIEAALEFGAEIAINLGVASGGVEIKAGVYFHWKEAIPDKGTVELAGYVRLHGELSVLGLISASLTFNLQLAYLKDQAAHTTSVWGEATLTVEVEIAFVGFDVSVTCRKEFAGGQGDPKFIELIPDKPTWAEYCNAFAVEA